MKVEHKQTIMQLEERLKNEHPTFRAPEGFTEKVMARLDTRQPAARARHSSPLFRFGLGLIPVSLLLLLAFKQLPQRNPPPDPQQLADAISKIQIPEISIENINAFTAKLDEPLEAELKNVISDTRQAIQFVASNFLPEN